MLLRYKNFLFLIDWKQPLFSFSTIFFLGVYIIWDIQRNKHDYKECILSVWIFFLSIRNKQETVRLYKIRLKIIQRWEQIKFSNFWIDRNWYVPNSEWKFLTNVINRILSKLVIDPRWFSYKWTTIFCWIAIEFSTIKLAKKK